MSSLKDIYDAYNYWVTDIVIYSDSFYSRRMIYPRKNQKMTFDELCELIDSIKKNKYLVYFGKNHSDDENFKLEIYADRNRDPFDIIGKAEDMVAIYEFGVDINYEALRKIHDIIYDYCE